MRDDRLITICCADGGCAADAQALAEKLGLPTASVPGDGLNVVFDADGVSLMGYGMRYRGDFSEMLRRLTGGRLAHEMLAHIAKTKKENPTAIDATAGMGEDSILLAASGYTVTMFEQNPVIAALLRDAMRRGADDPELAPILARMHLYEEDSTKSAPLLCRDADLVYLDPMFPARQKSGLIGKKLQLIQKLEQPCTAEETLWQMAVALHPGKIVVKRPLKGPVLAGKVPGYTVKGKAIRYDCYVLPADPHGKDEETK